MPYLNSPFSFRRLARKIKDKLKQKLINIYFGDSIKISKLNVFYSYNSEYIKCSWNLTNKHIKDLKDNNIFCLGLRIYDITEFSTESPKATCIMKEIDVNKNSNESLVPLAIDNGKILIELGYRDFKNIWNQITSEVVNLSTREPLNKYVEDSWFYLTPESRLIPDSLHHRLYQYSKNRNLGGSENIHSGGSENYQSKNNNN